jgi:hypothetical protein
MTGLNIRISRKTLGIVFAVAIGLLTLAGAVTAYLRIARGHTSMLGLVALFNLDREANLPAWYSSATLLLCAVLLAVIAADKRHAADRYARHWIGLALIFLFLAADEAAGIHENFGRWGTRLLGLDRPSHFAWLAISVPLVTIISLIYARFFLRLPRRTMIFFLIAAILFLGGVFGIETIGYSFLTGPRGTYASLAILEEFAEMTGIAVFALALVDYLRATAPEITIRFE